MHCEQTHNWSACTLIAKWREEAELAKQQRISRSSNFWKFNLFKRFERLFFFGKKEREIEGKSILNILKGVTEFFSMTTFLLYYT